MKSVPKLTVFYGKAGPSKVNTEIANDEEPVAQMDVDVSAPIQSEDCQPGSSTSNSSILPSGDILQSDPALWKVDRHFQEEIVKMPIEQNIYKQDFSRSEKEHNGHKRYLTKSLFERTMPDISHVDQLTFIVRYVGSHGRPIERFINFVEVHSHKAENLANVVKDVITEDLGLDISSLHGQGYDNASNMADAYSGLQARIKELNELAHFVPCAAHSLNLVGASSADSCLDAITFCKTCTHSLHPPHCVKVHHMK
ncbi:uncharacterized protein LOC106478345 [Limulus polyphemus]|uniref:Uncharacterized protein LOC106478345 n=1 Tax=Limulus polyphemus TaxID=6850 RepID=A0ABM1C542_LIMPO|nr:uncharacterized protein LOC106478345 [Limulus polyphemus]